MDEGLVPGFAPSTHGLHFPNAFPPEALIHLTVPVVGDVPIGDASNGLCGGMAFTARDLFEAGANPGPETSPPAQGSPEFAYIVQRLIDSFDLPNGPLRYLALMEPWLPDNAGFLGGVVHGRPWVMIEQEWPAIRATIDGGHLCPLGLIRILSADPRDLGHNHQVVAYRYTLDGTALRIGVYDPNHPDDDTVEIGLDIANPTAHTDVSYSPGDGPVYCFFRAEYSVSRPAPWLSAAPVG